MNSTPFLTSTPKGIYERVFCPLAEGCQTIEESESKAYYGILPYAKLRTAFESNPEQVVLQCNVIENHSRSSIFQKAFTGARNAIGNTVNSLRPDTTWNCSRLHTAQALDTAIDVFSNRAGEINKELESINDPVELVALLEEVKQIHSLLTTSLKTVFYVYRTYHEISDTGNTVEEKAEYDSEPKTLHSQYRHLQVLIESGIDDLLMSIQSKLTPDESPVEQGEGKSATPEESEQREVPAEGYNDAVKAMTNKALVFKSPEAASKWFLKKLENSRSSRETNGDDVYADLMKSSKTRVWETFSSFAESLDKTFRDEIARYHSAQEVFDSMKPIREIPKQPENFQALLLQLCQKKAERKVYQAFFLALINEEGTAPRGMGYQPALLNAIMNSPYFPMFDSESI